MGVKDLIKRYDAGAPATPATPATGAVSALVQKYESAPTPAPSPTPASFKSSTSRQFKVLDPVTGAMKSFSFTPDPRTLAEQKGAKVFDYLSKKSESFSNFLDEKLKDVPFFEHRKKVKEGMGGAQSMIALAKGDPNYAQVVQQDIKDRAESVGALKRGTAFLMKLPSEFVNFISRQMYDGKSNAVADWVNGFADQFAKANKTARSERISQMEFGVDKFTDPDFWRISAVEQVPMTLGFLGGSLATTKGVSMAGKFVPLLKNTLVQYGIGGVTMRGFEGAMEAEETYARAKEKGWSEEDSLKASREVFYKNLSLSGLDATQIALLFATQGRFKGTNTMSKILYGTGALGLAGLTEGGEEVAQYAFQKSSLKEDYSLLDPEALEAGVLGFTMGMVFQVAGSTHVSRGKEDKSEYLDALATKLPSAQQAVYEQAKTPKEKEQVLDMIAKNSPESVTEAVILLEQEHQKTAQSIKEVHNTLRSLPDPDTVRDMLDSGMSREEVGLELGNRGMGAQDALVLVDGVISGEVPTTTKQVAQEIDTTLAEKTASHIKKEQDAKMARALKDIADMQKDIAELQKKIRKTEDKAQKAVLKTELEVKREALRNAEQVKEQDTVRHAQGLRALVEQQASEMGVTDVKVIDRAVAVAMNARGATPMREVVRTALTGTDTKTQDSVPAKKEVNQKPFKESVATSEKSEKKPAKPKETPEIRFSKELGVYVAGINKPNNKVELLGTFSTEAEAIAYVKEKTGVELTEKDEKPAKTTQKDKVKKVVEKKGKASIKEIAVRVDSLDKKEITDNTKDNETTNDTGSDDNKGGVSEPVPDEPKRPRTPKETATVAQREDGDRNDGAGGSDAGERPTVGKRQRVTNESAEGKKTMPINLPKLPPQEEALWRATKPDGTTPLDVDLLAKYPDTLKLLNYADGQWYLDFNYAQGDIYAKLEQLEKDYQNTKDGKDKRMDSDRYERQKAKLLAVLPVPETVGDMNLTPNMKFVKDFKVGEDTTLASAFRSWLQRLPRDAMSPSNVWEISGYINNEQVRGNDKQMNERVRDRRKRMADKLFAKYIQTELSASEQKALEKKYNETFNFFHTPDYTQVPLFGEINTTFGGKPFKLNTAQQRGVGRLMSAGVGVLAHEVGFGKTISGVLTAYEAMQRGWAKRPLIVVPNDNIAKQWIDKTIMELIPNAKVNFLGNLGVSFKGDLASLQIEEGSFTVVTFEGLKRLSFTDETYARMSEKFSYLTDELGKNKTARDIEKEKAETASHKGKMKKGTRADLTFEGLGFDHITVDEASNANHVVGKVKLEKGEASEFNRFGLVPSALGVKTWLASQYVQEQNNGRNVTLLSATPFTNHPLEYYSILSMVADQSLEKMGFRNVNEFFSTFMEASSEMEFKADGSYEKKTDIRGFKNYRQFRKLIDSYIDFQQENPDIVRPNRIQKSYEIPKNELVLQMEQQAQEIFSENEKESGKGAKMLRAINELQLIAISPYLSQFSETAPSYKEYVENSPKLDVMMKIIAQNKKDKPEAGQIIYSQKGVSVFPYLKEYLVKEVGFKESEVAIVVGGDGSVSPAKRVQIQNDFNDGKIKILIGSDTITEGMNLQINTTDMHLLSLPWNFTALRQVIGRAWRQQNQWKNVRINQYFMQDSVDVFMSQKLDNKQRRWENAIKSNANTVDVGDVSFNDFKFDLVKDPEARAKLEMQSKREELSLALETEKAELAFATRRLEKVSELQEELAGYKKRLEDELAKDPADVNTFWVERNTVSIQKLEKEIKGTLDALSQRGVSVESLLETKKAGEEKIRSISEEMNSLDDVFKKRVEELKENVTAPMIYSKETAVLFVNERAQENKTFYEKADAPKKEVVTVARAQKLTKADVPKVEVVKRKNTTQSKSKDARTMKILEDSSMTVNEKVTALLDTKQEDKEYKDVGERVSGSKKERATIRAVLENADASVIAEVIRTLGGDAVAETLNKTEILDGAIVPNYEADQKAKVPAMIADWKMRVFHNIAKTPALTTKRSKYSQYANVDIEDMAQFLTEYPERLRTFAEELANVTTPEDVESFSNKHRYVFARFGSVSENVIRGQGVAHINVLGKTVGKILQEAYSIERKADEFAKEKDGDYKRKLGEVYQTGYHLYQKKKAPVLDGLDLSHGNFAPIKKYDREGEIPAIRVKAETLTSELGFKSVQLGNYMDDATAKQHIEQTILAIEDLSKVLKIDFPKLFHDRGLSIAYGARGGGKYNAHYELTKNIINITKSRGDGSLWHELVHFLDTKFNAGAYYRDKWSSTRTRYSTTRPIEKSSLDLMNALTGRKITKEKTFEPREDSAVLSRQDNDIMQLYAEGKTYEQAIQYVKEYGQYSQSSDYQNVADVYRKPVTAKVTVWGEGTEYMESSRKVGGGSSDSYWVKPHELLARAGQAYIEDKMIEAGISNKYITNTTIGRPAYPQGQERKIFNELFDKVFADVAKEYPLPDATIPARFKEKGFYLKSAQTGKLLGSIPSAYVKTVDADSLVPSSSSLEDAVRDVKMGKTSKSTLPLLVKELPNGMYKIVDGHHRFARNVLGMNEPRVAVVTDEKAYRQMADIEEGTLKWRESMFAGEDSIPSTPSALPSQAKVAGSYALPFLRDFKRRYNINFNVRFVDTILADEWAQKNKPPQEAYGAMIDSTLVFAKEITRWTAQHETGHLVFNNLDRIPAFAKKGFTKKKLVQAKIKEMLSQGKRTIGKTAIDGEITSDVKGVVEEQIMLDFEEYLEKRYEPSAGLLRRFFVTLKRMLMDFGKAFKQSPDIITNFYEMIDTGREIDAEMTTLETSGIVDEYILSRQGQSLSYKEIGLLLGGARFKVRQEGDKVLQKIQKKYNEVEEQITKKVAELEKVAEEMDTAMDESHRIAERVAETPTEVKKLRKNIKEDGTLTPAGEARILKYGFANKEEAEKQITQYMRDKTELLETRNQLRKIRRQISSLKRGSKMDKTTLKDIERSLKLRKRFLESKSYYIEAGKAQGRKEQMRIIEKRGRTLSELQDTIGLSDARTQKLLGELGRQKMHLMSEKQFDDFILRFINQGTALANKLYEQDEVRAMIQEKQFSKEDNLRKALKLPTIKNMSAKQASMFARVLSEYEFGDVFLTQRQLETIHRTQWDGVKTEREMFARVFEHTNITKEDMKNIQVSSEFQKWKGWRVLAGSNPVFAWLVDRRFKASLESEANIVAFEEEMNPLVNKARASRKKTLGDKVKQIIAPTDKIVFGYMEAKDKEAYKKEHGMTTEEVDLAHWLMARLFMPAKDYMHSEYNMATRENYITHKRRGLAEAFISVLEEGGSLPQAVKTAVQEVFSSQKEDAVSFGILAGKTGEVVPFEKWFQFAMPRSGKINPTQNVAKASLAYARAYYKKRAIDSFVPESLSLLHMIKSVMKHTEKGLEIYPNVEKYIKEFLNDARGRKIEVVTQQGSPLDNALVLGMKAVAFKFLAFRSNIGIANFIGEYVSSAITLKTKEVARGVSRSFDWKKKQRVLQKYKHFTGRNPLSEILDPEHGLGQRVYRVGMSLFSLSSFFNSRFYLVAKMSEAEWQAEMMSDERMVDITKQMSRFRRTKHYITSLGGSTASAGVVNQFLTWAIPHVNSVIYDTQALYKTFKEKGAGEAITSEEARELGKILTLATTLFILANAIRAGFDVDDDDRNMLWYITREINTLLEAFGSVFDLEKRLASPFPLVGELIRVLVVFREILTQERYTQDGVGYGIGDLKAWNSIERLLKPTAVKDFERMFGLEKERENTRKRLIEEAIRGEFKPEEIAEFLNPKEWNNEKEMRDEKGHKEYQTRKVQELTMEYNVRKQFPNSPVVEIILSNKNNTQKVNELQALSDEVGKEAVQKEVIEIYRNKRLCGNPRQKTVCPISDQFFKDYRRAM